MTEAVPVCLVVPPGSACGFWFTERRDREVHGEDSVVRGPQWGMAFHLNRFAEVRHHKVQGVVSTCGDVDMLLQAMDIAEFLGCFSCQGNLGAPYSCCIVDIEVPCGDNIVTVAAGLI